MPETVGIELSYADYVKLLSVIRAREDEARKLSRRGMKDDQKYKQLEHDLHVLKMKISQQV